LARGPKSLAAGHIANFQTSPRACLKKVNMPNRRGFCPLDGAIFPCNPPGFLGQNCLPAAQNPSLPDTAPIFKQAPEGKLFQQPKGLVVCEAQAASPFVLPLMRPPPQQSRPSKGGKVPFFPLTGAAKYCIIFML
ncbi:hypothetical protein, partial [uncultured Intestinimonas sp.]|uniref:hypothetical protein n=1 Tax=uncultured Intestinimonas sp. TaxID=1689265 RepID=UPI0025DB4D8A